MFNQFFKISRAFHLGGDFFCLNLSFVLGYWVRFGKLGPFTEKYLYLLILFNFFWMLLAGSSSIYKLDYIFRIDRVILELFKLILVHFLITTALLFLIKDPPFSRELLFFTYAFLFSSLTLWKIVMHYGIRRWRKRKGHQRKFIILGVGAEAQAIKEFFESDLSYGFKFMGYFNKETNFSIAEEDYAGKIEDVKQFVLENQVREIYCSLPAYEEKEINDILRFSENNMIRFRLVPHFMKYTGTKATIEFFGNVPVIAMRKEPLQSIVNRGIKRTFDVLFSLTAILFVLSWLIPILAILIKISSKGPVFFSQKRSGKNKQIFNCYKLRSMSVNIESDSEQAKKHDDRTTRVGQFLRRNNLDELPQFFNVLKGEMTVVGPRPHMLKHTEEYSSMIDQYLIRHLIKPGITGWAQVNGFRGATEDPYLMKKRVQYDVWYLENWDIFLDLRIIYLTVKNMFVGEKNAY